MNAFPAAGGSKPAPLVARLLGLAAMAALLYGMGGCAKTPGDLRALAKGAMAKLAVTARAPAAPSATFADAAGHPHTLAELRGKVVLVNLWANWCAPCKLEIPSLAKLQTAYATAPVAVVAVSLGKGEDETAGRAFIARNPPLIFYSDPTYQLPYAFRPPIEDLPTTLIFDRRGRERATLAGGADWSSAQARAVVDRLLAEK